MPQLLIVGQDDEFCLTVEQLIQDSGAASQGLRAKHTTSPEVATTWLEMGGFNGVIFDPRLDFSLQSKLAGQLWEKILIAPFIIYGPGYSGKQDAEARLMGSEFYIGKNAEKRLIDTLRNLAQVVEKPGYDSLLKVAVVEDLESPRDIICTYLEGVDNLQALGFASADEILASLEKDPKQFDLIITDIRMPKKSGEELIQILRAKPETSKIPIIVLTAYGTADIMMGCLKAGATGFMVKPPKKKDLKQEISRVRRIIKYRLDPRLVFPDEIEKMREILEARGLF